MEGEGCGVEDACCSDGGVNVPDSFVALSIEGVKLGEETFIVAFPVGTPTGFTLYHLVDSGQDNFAVSLLGPSRMSV